MIINIHGPQLVPGSKYKELHEEILTFFSRTDRMFRGFNRESVRIFFHAHRLIPQNVEFQIFAGSSAATLNDDKRSWQNGLVALGEKYWPHHVINGFIDTLDATSQFGGALPKKQIQAA